MSNGNNIWADMMAELQHVKAAAVDPRPMIDRLKVGDRVRLRKGWVLWREDLKGVSKDTGEVTEITRRVDIENNLRIREDGGELWTTHSDYIIEIIS